MASLALRDRIISAAVGAAIASVIVPAEARAPASLGLGGQFNLFPYNTSYNRNSAHLGRFGATLRTANLSDAPVTEYVGRGSLGELFGDRFLASAAGHRGRSHASSRGFGEGLTSSGGGRRVFGTVLTYGNAGKQFASGNSSFDLTSARLSRRAGSGSVGVASDDADGGLYYTSASQAAAATALGSGRATTGDSLHWSSGAGNGGVMGGIHGSGSRGGTTFTVSGAGASGGGSVVSSAAPSGSSFGAGGFGLSSSLGGGSGGSQNFTRTVTLGGLNGSVVTPGGGGSGGGSSAGSSGANGGAGINGNSANAGTNGNNGSGGTLFPDAKPVGAIAPAPVPEPGIVVTTLSLLGMTGFGLLRGRRRRA